MNEDDAATLSVSQRIKRVREALQLNQRDFSTLLSLSSGYISGVETNVRPVNARLIKLIVSEFSVNETWLASGEGEMFIRNSDEKFAKLLSLFKELPAKYQDVVFKMIEMLRKVDEGDESIKEMDNG
jgi:transcriptional regulator with XRE-family HTH domain